MTTMQILTRDEACDRGYVHCLLDGNRGIYLPQSFAKQFDRQAWGLGDSCFDDDWATLLNGPDDDYYWDAWNSIVDFAHWTDENNRQWRLEQDSDLFVMVSRDGNVEIYIED